MSDKTNKYWQDVECKELSAEHLKSEFHEAELNFDIGSIKKSRRSFLSVMGFSFTALPLLSSCLKIPIKKSLPYLYKSDQVVPGVANWYATSMDPLFGEALLVKTREGRPIKIEGNPLSPISKGATMPGSQASLLSLYDGHRYKKPLLNDQSSDWDTIINNLKEKLVKQTKKTYLVTRSLSSPSSIRLINEIKKKYPHFQHIIYESSSMSSMIAANQLMFGSASYSRFEMDKADLVVSFSADFLGTWLNPAQLTKQYTSRRDLIEHKDILRHVQFESLLSLTGSNADQRFTVTPKEERDFILNLFSEIQKMAGRQLLPVGQKIESTNTDLVKKMAIELWDHKGKSLVLSGSHDQDIQMMINGINHLLGNYTKTIHVEENKHFLGPEDHKFEDFIDEMKNGKIGTVFFWSVNPVHTYYHPEKFKAALEKVENKILLSESPNETSKLCTHILPINHFLESWNDYYQAPGVLTSAQAVVRTLFNSKMPQELLMTLFNIQGDYYHFLEKTASSYFLLTGEKFKQYIHDGVHTVDEKRKPFLSPDLEFIKISFSRLLGHKEDPLFTLLPYEKTAFRTGEMINNPWLQEMPDPITKATWDNYFLMSPKKAKEMGIKNGDVIEVTLNSTSKSLPVLVQPGVAYNVIGMAIGYGRQVSGKVAKNLGENAYSFYQYENKTYGMSDDRAIIKKTLKKRPLALTQTHHSMEGRDIVRETTLKEWKNDPSAGSLPSVKLVSMWAGHKKTGEQWAMAIDLNKCTGCSGCIVSCNAENNVSVVGREEVKNRREMHWLRIDRYYKGDENQPEVVHQPLMCQHCDNAPCETVCPVLATVQSSDGLNQQIYNRCVGTRYCGNNCPYKVRRFNWFDYPHDDPMEKMVLNPDVVVRSRGVMEKCSMCIQRIQEARLDAKINRRDLKDGDIKLACQQSCPGDAIVFGNLNDPKSKVSKLLKNARAYRLLEEINIDPRISYLNKVRNKE